MMKQRIIGLSGLAGAGKDFFLQEMQKYNPKFHRFALADELKKELEPHLQSLYGVNIFTCSREMKNKVRPILVEHGKIRRIDSHGTHWTSILKGQIESFLNSNPDSYACVTDIRYDFYDKDEVEWLRDEMGGTLVHISRYSECPSDKTQKLFISPPNTDEAENDPKVKAKADYRVEWPTLLNEDGSIDREQLQPYVTDFLKYLQG